MAISIDIPADLESALRRQIRDLNQAAKEALLVEFCRQKQITDWQLGQALSLSRFEVDELLKRHGVDYDITAEEVGQEARELEALRRAHADRR